MVIPCSEMTTKVNTITWKKQPGLLLMQPLSNLFRRQRMAEDAWLALVNQYAGNDKWEAELTGKRAASTQ